MHGIDTIIVGDPKRVRFGWHPSKAAAGSV
jgi:hypothetical protein